MERFQKPKDDALYLSELFVPEKSLEDNEQVEESEEGRDTGPELPPRLKFDTD